MILRIIFYTMVTNVEASRQARRPEGLRERKRTATQRRIADAAVRLASAHGVTATTVEEIAAEAGVGRATFFRYFDSKELAVATGLSDVGAYVLAAVIGEVDPALGPLEAVRAAYRHLGTGFDANRAMFLEQAELSRSSAAMFAWTLYLYVDWEIAIARATASRFSDLVDADPRPRMLGALTMTAARLACDDWVADGGRGDLPDLIQTQLSAVHLAQGAS
ncbi:MAG: Transcriptional regulatory protein [Marmoricola sp.]|nr:Transcriptional regulatory protein [Marmoricola sp.]